MGRGKKYQSEQFVNLLRQIEIAVAVGKTTGLACKEAGIVEQTYFRWRKKYGGLQVGQAKWRKELEQKNSKLNRFGRTTTNAFPVSGHQLPLRRLTGNNPVQCRGCF